MTPINTSTKGFPVDIRMASNGFIVTTNSSPMMRNQSIVAYQDDVFVFESMSSLLRHIEIHFAPQSEEAAKKLKL